MLKSLTTKSYHMICFCAHTNSLYLNEFRQNMASNLGRSLSNHSYDYAFSSDQPTLFATFPLIFVPFTNYPG